MPVDFHAHRRWKNARPGGFCALAVLPWLTSGLLAACDPGAPSPSSAVALGPLTSLAVTTLSISPPFSPQIYDYTIPCRVGTNSITIEMATAPGGTAELSAPLLSPLASTQSVTLTLTEDQAAVIQASAPGRDSAQYWIRCLPHDFPAVSVTRYPDAGRSRSRWRPSMPTSYARMPG